MKKVRIESLSISTFILFVFVAIFVPGRGPDPLMIALLSVSTFLFGIFGAHVMQNRHKRLDELRATLNRDNASYLNVYNLSKVFGKQIQNKIQKLIDDYLILTIDYKLKDIYKANDEYLKFYNYVINLKPKNQAQTIAYEEMISLMNNANSNRKYIEYLVRDEMQKFKWISLISLLGIIIFSIFYINDNRLISIIITVLLSSAGSLLLLIIRELDSLRWKEEKWAWGPLEELFLELDTLPYYAEEIIKKQRVKLKKGTKIRVASYPNKYPNFKGKKIKIITVK